MGLTKAKDMQGILSDSLLYNEFKHDAIFASQYQFKMNCCFDLEDFRSQNSPFQILDSRFDSHCFADRQFSFPLLQKDAQNKSYQAASVPLANQLNGDSFIFQQPLPNLQVFSASEVKKARKNRKKQIIKPSPYHNYQKHLNSTLKQLVRLPKIDHFPSCPHTIARDLWLFFTQSTLTTKKILHFVFNKFNQYKITQEELKQLGFSDIYTAASPQHLCEAKNYLTQITLSQLNEGNIDEYLRLRRIKNQIKFKKYLLLFRQELEDGFLKKRLTNRSRKDQIKKQLCKECSS